MSAETALITGYPNFVVRRLVKRLAARGDTLFLLCKEDFEDKAAADFEHLRDRVRIVTGDVVCMDLGLSGPEVREIRAQAEVVYHLAGIYFLGSDESEMEMGNIEGTRNALSFALEMPHLRRFMHYSTAFVSGSREGVVLEDDLIRPSRFRNPFERTKFIAEKVVRSAMSQLPCTVVRPSLIVGDSTSGEIDKMDGPHFIMHVLVNLPLDISLPLVGKGAFPLNMVPVDFVVDALAHIAGDPRAVAKTYHLVDLNPLPARRVFELLCSVAQKKPPRRHIPSNLATALMKMPGLERHWRSPRLFVECLNQLVLYNAMNTTEILRGSGIMCPPFPSYVENLVAFLRRRKRTR